MATFKTQVEALTGISIDGSSNPTQTELSSFLVDGVKDVIHRMIEVRPAELPRFCSTTDSGAGAFVAKVGNILSVVREHDSPSILRKCIQIDPGDRYDATDSESLNYRSKTNPGFYELNGKIHTVPVAAESGDNNVVVTQLFYDTGVAHGDEVPDNFPESYAYLVAIYASIQSLKAKMSNSIISIVAVPPDVPTLTSVTFSSVGSDVDAALPTYTAATVSAGGVYGSSTAPAYAAPTTTITGETWVNEYPVAQADLATPLGAIVTNVDLAKSVIDSVPVPPDAPTAPSFTAPAITSSTVSSTFDPTSNGPAYTPPKVGGATEELTTNMGTGSSKTDFSDWFDQVGDYIETDEDVELASAQLQKISAYLQSYSSAMQNQLNEFNEANVEYQAEIQQAITQAQINAQEYQQEASLLLQKEQQEYSSKLQKYSAEISEYQAEIGAMTAQAQGYLNTAQGYAGEINTRLSITQTKISEYQARAQDSLQEFNEDNAAFQANIQEAMQEIQVANQVNIAAAQGELQLNMDNENRSQQRQLQNSINDMQAIVANNDDLMGKFTAETTEYQVEVSTEVQEKTTKMQQYKALHDQLLLDYNAAFGVTEAEA